MTAELRWYWWHYGMQPWELWFSFMGSLPHCWLVIYGMQEEGLPTTLGPLHFLTTLVQLSFFFFFFFLLISHWNLRFQSSFPEKVLVWFRLPSMPFALLFQAPSIGICLQLPTWCFDRSLQPPPHYNAGSTRRGRLSILFILIYIKHPWLRHLMYI